MSLGFGNGPFAELDHRGSFDVDGLPDHVRYWEPWPRRMRAVLRGRTLLDSRRGVMLHETGALPILYFPFEDLAPELWQPGTEADGVRRWSLRLEGHDISDCLTSSPLDEDGSELLPSFVTLAFEAPERWFEEDDPIYAHVRDPYHRVDVLSSSRWVEIRLGEQIIADSRRPKLLFETGLPVRVYIPFNDVRIELLERSDTVSECPYKGDGRHWHLRAEEEVRDAGWSLPHPLPEALGAAEHVCFYADKVEVRIDGERVSE